MQYEALAKKLRKVDDLVIARIEATENDVPEAYVIKGQAAGCVLGGIMSDVVHSSFPTLFFKPKGHSPQLIEYQGDRDVDDLLNFLRKNAEARVPRFKKKQPSVSWLQAVDVSAQHPPSSFDCRDQKKSCRQHITMCLGTI
jgi:hypothetical protein